MIKSGSQLEKLVPIKCHKKDLRKDINSIHAPILTDFTKFNYSAKKSSISHITFQLPSVSKNTIKMWRVQITISAWHKLSKLNLCWQPINTNRPVSKKQMSEWIPFLRRLSTNIKRNSLLGYSVKWLSH